ncbi:glycosyltransferase [Caldimonas sp. KR1-144]|uniref:glycosyltransferase n=1 Tax=Caldimonas sp. KR1-144 TaxID=3400911 RepID=UPI003C0AF22F
MAEAFSAQAGEPGAPWLRSFWIGGFEGADHVNRAGERLDMAAANGHLRMLAEDYTAARELGIGAVRESVGWRIAEPRERRRRLARACEMAEQARRAGVQVLWSLMHHGLPDDLSLDDDRLVERFAEFAYDVASALAPYHDDAPVYTPIDEIGLAAWGAASGMFGRPGEPPVLTPPDTPAQRAQSEARSERIRRRLVTAALRATAAIRAADSRARFMAIEPLGHVVAAARADEPLARQANASQWRVLDMLLGREAPELGGQERALDLIGLCHYASSQWELPSQQRLAWDGSDPRRRPLAELLDEAARRYRRALLLQTSHVGSERTAWLHEVCAQARAAQRRRVPLAGLCLYPLVDRNDWDDTAVWHHSGLWDIRDDAQPQPAGPVLVDDSLRRVPVAELQDALRAWQPQLPAASAPPPPAVTIVAFSHVRWRGVFARPQQLLGRLAQRFRVVYVEEPVPAPGPARLVCSSAGPGIEVITPHTPIDEPGFHDAQLPGLKPLLDSHFQSLDGSELVLWFCTAMALPLAASLRPRAVVYDCVEDLSAFKDAPRQLRQRESALMRSAQLVLAGGPRLFEARRDSHANIHCLPNGVDARRFAPHALADGCAAQGEAQRLMQPIGTPRLGFYGVIDERLDLALVERLADADPQWQIVMVGPIARIDAARLPRRDNLHWLGLQPHAMLAHLLASWDVCLLPFARNAATRFACPGQVLEYLASGKPVVATAVGDVPALYGEAVTLAQDHGGFVVACVKALIERPAWREEREARARELVEASSWERAAERAGALLDEVLARPPLEPAAVDDETAMPPPYAPPHAPAMPHAKRVRTRSISHLVVGGGVAGLAAAWQLGQDGLAARTLLVERADRLGASLRSARAGGCEFEYADLGLPDSDAARTLMQRLLGRNLQWRTTVISFAGGAPEAALFGSDEAGAIAHAAGRADARRSATLILPAPARGGAKALVDACARRIDAQVALKTALLRLSPSSHTARLDDGRSVHYEALVSTMPLPDLVAACGSDIPAPLRRAAAQLRTRPARCLWFGLRRADPLAVDRCLYLPASAPFQRALVCTASRSFGTNASPFREGLVIVRLDIAQPAGAEAQREPAARDEPGVQALLLACRRLGLIRPHDTVVAQWELRLPGAYPLDDGARAARVQALREWFAARDIELAGHFGAWGGDGGMHALEAGQRAVLRLREHRRAQAPDAG